MARVDIRSGLSVVTLSVGPVQICHAVIGATAEVTAVAALAPKVLAKNDVGGRTLIESGLAAVPVVELIGVEGFGGRHAYN